MPEEAYAAGNVGQAHSGRRERCAGEALTQAERGPGDGAAAAVTVCSGVGGPAAGPSRPAVAL